MTNHTTESFDRLRLLRAFKPDAFPIDPVLFDLLVPGRIGAEAWAVYTMLVRWDYSFDFGTVLPTDWVMGATGLSRAKAKKAVALLEKVQLIECRGNEGYEIHYRILPSDGIAEANGWDINEWEVKKA